MRARYFDDYGGGEWSTGQVQDERAITLALDDGDSSAICPLTNDDFGVGHRLILRVKQSTRQPSRASGTNHRRWLGPPKYQGAPQQQDGQQEPSLAVRG